MYEKLLSEAEKFLEDQKTKELPILELWAGLSEHAEQEKFELPENIGDFECLLEADKRFVLKTSKLVDEVEAVDVGEEEGEYEVSEDYFEVEEMEKLGFNQNQIVGLKEYEKKTIAEDEDDDVVPVKSGAVVKKKKKAAKNIVTKKKPKAKKTAPAKKKKK